MQSIGVGSHHSQIEQGDHVCNGSVEVQPQAQVAVTSPTKCTRRFAGYRRCEANVAATHRTQTIRNDGVVVPAVAPVNQLFGMVCKANASSSKLLRADEQMALPFGKLKPLLDFASHQGLHLVPRVENTTPRRQDCDNFIQKGKAAGPYGQPLTQCTVTQDVQSIL